MSDQNSTAPDPSDAVPGYEPPKPQEPAEAPGGYQPPAAAPESAAPVTGGYEPPAATPSYSPPAATGGYEPPAATPPAWTPPSTGYEAPTAGGYSAPAAGGYSAPDAGGYNPPAGGYAPPPTGGYEPPSAGGYEPPSAGGYTAPAAGGYTQPPAGGGFPEPPGPGSYPPPPPGYGQQPGYDPNAAYGGGYPPVPVPGAGAGALADWPKRALGGLVDYVAPSIIISILANVVGNASSTLGTAVSVLLGLGWWCYLGYKSGTTGVTFGRSLAKTKLISAETGQVVGVQNGILRQFAHIVDSIICYVGWLFPLWDAQKQTLADKIMKTVVVDNSADPNAGTYNWG